MRKASIRISDFAGETLRVAVEGERARFSPSKIRRRTEEKLGWQEGSSRDISFAMLKEALGGRFPKLSADIEAMQRTGDHLVEEESAGVAEERYRRHKAWSR